jgi:hypothetical protein
MVLVVLVVVLALARIAAPGHDRGAVQPGLARDERRLSVRVRIEAPVGGGAQPTLSCASYLGVCRLPVVLRARLELATSS